MGAIEEDRPRSQRALPARAGQDLAMIFFVILAAVAIGGSILLWFLRIPPFG